MSKVLVVFGATGQQGGSIINFVLNDAELSKEFQIRAVTRNISAPAAKTLQTRAVEVVSADLDNLDSVVTAVGGAHTVFGVTSTIYDQQLRSRE